MQIGFGVLRLAPAALWSMSPREFAAAVGWLSPAATRPTRSDLGALMKAFPDWDTRDR